MSCIYSAEEVGKNILYDYIFDNKYIDTDLNFVFSNLLNQLKFEYNNILLIGNNIKDLNVFIKNKYNNANISCLDINHSIDKVSILN